MSAQQLKKCVEALLRSAFSVVEYGLYFYRTTFKSSLQHIGKLFGNASGICSGDRRKHKGKAIFIVQLFNHGCPGGVGIADEHNAGVELLCRQPFVDLVEKDNVPI